MGRKPYREVTKLSVSEDAEVHARAEAFAARMARRRTVREFSSRSVPPEALAAFVRAAGSAPSGANQQPWHFVVVTDPGAKREIRLQAEAEERAFYEDYAPEDWLSALRPIGTNREKEFLERAPALIVVFMERYGLGADGERIKRYYAKESVGIATGLLVTAVHDAGLASVTYTPGRMTFLRDALNRGENEMPFVVLAIGHPAPDATVPSLTRKPLEDLATFF